MGTSDLESSSCAFAYAKRTCGVSADQELRMPIFSRQSRIAGQPRRWRYRLRSLLVAVLVTGLCLGWLARHLRREREQVAIVAELNQAGIYAWQYDPNSVGWMVQRLPSSTQHWLLLDRLRWTFCYGPSRISAFSVSDETIPYLIDRMKRLPYVKSVSFGHGQISPEGEEQIRKALPNAEIDVHPSIGTFPCRSLACERCKARQTRVGLTREAGGLTSRTKHALTCGGHSNSRIPVFSGVVSGGKPLLEREQAPALHRGTWLEPGFAFSPIRSGRVVR